MTSNQKYEGPVDVFIGGAGDFKTKLVKRYQEAFEARHKTRSVFYFEHTQFGQAQSTLDALPAGQDINLIGHSYGAAMAVRLAKNTDKIINTLIGVDPVNKLIVSKGPKVLKDVRRIVMVTATGTENRLYDGNTIALVGRVFGGGVPKTFKHDTALQIHAPFAHYNFEALMEYKDPQGISASRILLEDARDLYV